MPFLFFVVRVFIKGPEHDTGAIFVIVDKKRPNFKDDINLILLNCIHLSSPQKSINIVKLMVGQMLIVRLN